MKAPIAGTTGFMGKNLCATLDRDERYELLKVTRQTTVAELAEYLSPDYAGLVEI